MITAFLATVGVGLGLIVTGLIVYVVIVAFIYAADYFGG